MPASVSVKQRTGASGSPTDTTVTNLRFTLADAANNGTNNPLAAPSSGTILSFFASLFLNADTAPATGISNVKFYSPGSNPWTGVTSQTGTASAYTQATGSGTTGVLLNSTNYSGLTSLADTFSYTSSSPLSVAGSIAATTGKISSFVVSQLTVSSLAVQGTLTSVQCYFSYDES